MLSYQDAVALNEVALILPFPAGGWFLPGPVPRPWSCCQLGPGGTKFANVSEGLSVGFRVSGVACRRRSEGIGGMRWVQGQAPVLG